MELQILGAAGTVTGSRFLVDGASGRVLVDCGLFQGLKNLRLRNRRNPGFDPSSVDAVVLTHAHVDHSGYLPALVKRGFRGPIYGTPATLDLCRILLPDSGRLQEEEASYANRKGFSKHRPALPLYTEEDAHVALRQLAPLELGAPLVVGDLSILLSRAGHILGAASVLVKSRGRSLLLSGDLGRQRDLLMLPPAPPPAADVVLIESTYGDRLHTKDDPIESLAAIVRTTVERGGIVLVPSFAVGRTQTILFALQEGFRRGLAPPVPVFVNSPMATAVTTLYTRYAGDQRLTPERLDRLDDDVRFVRDVEESKALSQRKEPAVIISASGMLTGGRVLHHLKSIAPDPANCIVLPGYQAAGTRGATLVRGDDSVKIHGAYVPVRAQVVSLDLYSAHADRDGLLAWLRQLPRSPREVLCVHGEAVAADELRRRIEETLGLTARVPEHGERVSV